MKKQFTIKGKKELIKAFEIYKKAKIYKFQNKKYIIKNKLFFNNLTNNQVVDIIEYIFTILTNDEKKL